uniref:Ig-like domain-containing protein n=1 Tax=Seriola dumerili TaxID=41447 RepID=A0A3B4T5H0_SERDU
MIITVLYLSLLLHSGGFYVPSQTVLLFSTCAAGLTVVVLQSGDHVFNKGATVTLECSLGPGLSMGSHTMYWYRQNHYRAPIEFLRKEYDTTVGFNQDRFPAQKSDAENGSLTVKKLLPEDSGVYFCAVTPGILLCKQRKTRAWGECKDRGGCK